VIQESEKYRIDDLLLLFVGDFLDVSQIFFYALSCDSEEIDFAIGEDNLKTFKSLRI
jgi:hypothetical protein